MRAFSIVLKQHSLSQEIFSEARVAASHNGVDLEVHDAVVGYHSQPKFTKYGIDQFLNYTIIDKPGHQGCFLSHFELWLKCLELNEPIIVTEHDGVFIRPLPEDVLDHFDEVLRLDCFKWFEDDYESQVQASLAQPVGYFRRSPDYSYHSSGGYYIGAYGYVIKPAGAEKLIKFAQQRGAVCTEAHLGLNIVDIVSTTATVVRMHPHYIGQDVKYSTTYDLGLMASGHNSLKNYTYISPNQYRKLYS